MQITEIKIKNYKSFIESPEIIFDKGFNVVVGQNNVGKTALLEGLSLSFSPKPHKSIKTKPHEGTALNGISTVDFTIKVSGGELYNILIEDAGRYPFPISEADAQSCSDLERYFYDFLEKNKIEFLYTKNSNQSHWTVKTKSSIKSFTECARLVVGNLGKGMSKFHGFVLSNVGQLDELGVSLYARFSSKIYCFRAERMNIASCNSKAATELSPNAGNLADVLHVLQSRNRPKFARYNLLVHQIFETIYEVRVVPVGAQQLMINLVIDEHDSERDDLLMSLDDCGTGVSQVLSILYVAITAESPKIIIIDEPNSFLHPGAARKLIEILKRDFPQHQYIVSTHSPEIISAADPSTITLLQWDRPVTKVTQLDSNNMQDLSICLSEVGARLSDVFGAEKILWVEGQTEEECFRLILNNVSADGLIGLSIVPVRNTGDFDGKKADLILDIYNRISTGNVLLPPLVGFVFDRENKSERQIEDIVRKSNGDVTFLNRRMYENYLLDSGAISHVMNTLPAFKDDKVTPENISEWLIKNGNGNKYINASVEEFSLDNREWLCGVDSARLLRDLFSELSEAKETYIKTVHSFMITKYLNEIKPECFDELRDLLVEIISNK